MKKRFLYPMFYNIKMCLKMGIPMGWAISGFVLMVQVFLAVDDSILSFGFLKYCGLLYFGIILSSFFISYFVPKVIRRVVVSSLIIGLIFTGFFWR